jgi:uncharacterized protein
MRHAAIVGSTGSGKTSAVAALLQGFVHGGWRAANIIVIDPHGEYAQALAGSASVRSVLAAGDHRLRVPYWALSATDIVRVFAGAPGGATFLGRYTEFVAEARRRFVDAAQWLTLDPSAVTADTPVPFDIRAVWHRLDFENNETRNSVAHPDTVQLVDPGDPAELRPARFAPYNPGGQAPHKAPFYGTYGTTPNLLRLGLLDPQLKFFQEPAGQPEVTIR